MVVEIVRSILIFSVSQSGGPITLPFIIRLYIHLLDITFISLPFIHSATHSYLANLPTLGTLSHGTIQSDTTNSIPTGCTRSACASALDAVARLPQPLFAPNTGSTFLHT